MVDLDRGIGRLLLNAQEIPRVRITAIVAAVVFFAVSSWLAYFMRMGQFFSISFVSVIIIAWLWGWRAGVAVGIVIPLLSIPIPVAHGVPPGIILIDELSFAFMAMACGAAVGMLSKQLSLVQRNTALEQKILEVTTFINNIPDMAWIKDVESRFIAVNKAFCDTVGMEADFLTDNTCEVCFGTEGAKKFREDDLAVMKGGEQVWIEETITDAAGRQVHLETVKSPIMGESGEVSGTVGVARDVGKRREAEQALQEAYSTLKETQAQLIQSGKLASIGQLAAGVAHELNQPLMVIRGKSQYALRKAETQALDHDEHVDCLQTIVRNTKRMMKVIDHLRTFSRQSVREWMNVNVNEVIDECFLMIGEQLRVNDIHVERRLAADLPNVTGDRHQLEQVLLNLIMNARDAIKERRTGAGDALLPTATNRDLVEIVTDVVDSGTNAIAISVKDNGHGINVEDAGKVFDPFFTTKSEKKGTGLGLSISYGIVKDHNGEIEVAETGPSGTTFRITLPIEQ